MLENIHLYTRLFVLVCAAVMSFIMCSDTTRASQIKRQADAGAEHRVFRRLYKPNNQQHQLFSGPPSPETGLQSGTSSKTETTWNQRAISSIINHQSKPLLFTGSSFGYSPNRPDNKHANSVISAQSRAQLGDNISSNKYLPNIERLQPRVNHPPTNRQIYNANSAIIRKSSHSAAAAHVHQIPAPSQVWNPSAVQTSYHQEQETIPVGDFSNQVGDKTVWQRYDLSPSSSQTRRYSSASLPTQRRHYSNHRETNGELGTSRVIPARNYPSSTSQTHTTSNRNRSPALVNKNNAEPQRPSIMDSSQGWNSERSSGMPGHKNVQSYLFKDSQTYFSGQSLNTGAAEGQSTFPTRTYVQKPPGRKFSLGFQQKVPTKNTEHSPESVNVLHQTAHVAQTDAYSQSYHSAAETVAQSSKHSLQDNGERFVPSLDADFQGNSATLRGQPGLSGAINPSTSGSMQLQKPAQMNKSIYGYRGFENSALKEPFAPSFGGLNDSTNLQRYTFNKGSIKRVNVYPSLSQKYSFGQRSLTNRPTKSERQQTDYFAPSPGTSVITKTQSPPRSFTPGVRQFPSQKLESDVGLDGKTDYGKFRIFRRVYGLKGFSNQPLGRAKALPSQPEKSTIVQQEFEGSKLRSSRIWRPDSSKTQKYGFNKTSGTEKALNLRENEPKLPLKTSGRANSTHRAMPERYKNYRRIYSFRGFQPVQSRIAKPVNQTTWRNKEQSQSQEMPSAFLRSTGPLKVLPHLKPDPEVSNKTQPVPMKASLLSGFTSSTVRGKRVRGKQDNAKNTSESTPRNSAVSIVRLPKQPKKTFRDLTHSDILGSTSFSSVRAKTQTPPADEFNNQNITAATEQKEVAHLTLISEDAVSDREKSSRGSEEQAEDKAAEEKKMDSRSEATDLKTSDSLQDTEGSGSGDFSLFDGFSVKGNRLSDDLLEVDYLRISAGNVSFKSMNVTGA